MSFLANLLERAKGFLDGPPAPPTATDAITHDRFDEATYADMRKDVPVIDKMIDELSLKHDHVADFFQDVHNTFVQGDPQLRDTTEMRPSHVPNHAIIQELAAMPEVQAMRSNTRHDPYAGAMATIAMKEELKQLVVRTSEARELAQQQELAQQEASAAAQSALEALQQAQQLQAQADATNDPNGIPDPNAQSAASQAAQAAEAALNAAQQAQSNVITAAEATAQATSSAIQGMRADVRAAAVAAADAAEEEAGLMAAFGVEDGELQRMSFTERAALAQRLKTNRLAQFAKLIGQFKALQAAESRRKVEHAPDEVNNIVFGNDLTRLAPAEWINLADDALEDDFWMRYVDGTLLCYDLIGSERVGQGPIIVVCDESGSMGCEVGQGVNAGTREAWSKAFSLALCEQARMKKRDFYYIGFSSGRQQWTVKMPEGKAKITEVIDMTEHFFGGGTHYEEPLRQALKLVQDYDDKDGKRPDIVFITDDEYGSLDEAFMHDWNKIKDRYDVRCYGIGLGVGVSGALSTVSDNVRSIGDLTADPREVADMFRTL